jgi:cobalt-zinc-cadmium efflux system outer membrane protein
MAAAYPQVLVSQRTLFQLQVDYVRALGELWQDAALLRHFTLNGALNAPAD